VPRRGATHDAHPVHQNALLGIFIRRHSYHCPTQLPPARSSRYQPYAEERCISDEQNTTRRTQQFPSPRRRLQKTGNNRRAFPFGEGHSFVGEGLALFSEANTEGHDKKPKKKQINKPALPVFIVPEITEDFRSIAPSAEMPALHHHCANDAESEPDDKGRKSKPVCWCPIRAVWSCEDA